MVKTNLGQELESFFVWFKETSEKQWEISEINRTLYGFQVQKGTKWLQGLSEHEIAKYERIMGFEFPEVYKVFLKHMNGTDKQTVNIYADCGVNYCYGVGFFSYPRDLELVKARIAGVLEAFQITTGDFEQKKIPHLMPIIEDRFLVMDRCEWTPALSIEDDDVIQYASSLPQLLVIEIGSILLGWDPHKLVANNTRNEQLARLGDLPFDIKVKFWLE
jgi:hypothetical protein